MKAFQAVQSHEKRKDTAHAFGVILFVLYPGSLTMPTGILSFCGKKNEIPSQVCRPHAALSEDRHVRRGLGVDDGGRILGPPFCFHYKINAGLLLRVLKEVMSLLNCAGMDKRGTIG
jgi:hypothetical protein